ncbi:MAG TPA: hypothetical protein VFL29_01185 [Candidatus Dormibacteraeota bacterium]|nr:hypothetical protein [Candidatus Dormibacteraeota bacterium]
MGIPIPRQRHPEPALVALIALALVAAVALVPLGIWAFNSFRPGSPPPVAVVTPTPSPAQSPTPSAPPSPVSVVATLHGKIAISSGQSGSGGWIQFPGGAFTADPKSNVSIQGNGWANGLAWNAAMNAWVPVNWYMVRNDGQVYAFMTWTPNGQTVQVVRKNGSTYLLGALPENNYGFNALGAEPEGVYVTSGSGQGGLWLLDYSGGVKQVAATGFWQLAAFGYAYGTVTPFVPQGGTNVIMRINLKTKAIANWFSRPGLESRVVGVTLDGTPIIEASNTTTAQVWLGTQNAKLLHTEVLDTTRQGPVYPGYQPQAAIYAITALGDQVGIWVATTNGLYLYTDKSGWELASQTTGQLASTIQ